MVVVVVVLVVVVVVGTGVVVVVVVGICSGKIPGTLNTVGIVNPSFA